MYTKKTRSVTSRFDNSLLSHTYQSIFKFEAQIQYVHARQKEEG
jgi:hypothetical protein